MGDRILKILAYCAAGVCIAPILAIILAAVSGDTETWRGLAFTVLPGYVRNTLLLVVLVSIGTAMIGTGAAWFVTMYRFPGVRLLEFLLILPLAFPSYVLAYAYTDLLSHPGAVQSALRAVTGWGPRDYWFPNVRSLPGAALMLTCVLYPYVYLLAKNAFTRQSITAYLAARTLGKSSLGAFWYVSLPMARPAIIGGVLLAIMETIADYGTVAYFSVPTFSTGIYQAWFSMGNRAAAAQLAMCLLGFALLLATLERLQRGQAKHHSRGGLGTFHELQSVNGVRGWTMSFFCFVPVFVGFLLPMVVLSGMAWDSRAVIDYRYIGFVSNSMLLAIVAAGMTIAGAVLVSFQSRVSSSWHTRGMLFGAGLGYAVPGGVIAVGFLVPFATLDNAIDNWMRGMFGISTGLIFTGSIFLLVAAYVARFMAAGLNTVGAGMETISPSIDAVARTLGRRPQGVLFGVHLPILKGSVLTAILIVFVDVMKELPATLIMRPFNFDTLAVQAHRLASDERLNQAAVPSLIMVVIGLVPVLLVCRQLAHRTGGAVSDQARPPRHI